MRLATASVDGSTRLFVETPTGLLDLAARIPDLGAIRDVKGLLEAGPDARARLEALADDETGSRSRLEDLHLCAPVIKPPKLIGIGLNYRAHAAEGGDELPSRPIIFAKFANTVIGSGDNIVHPRITESLDYEGELGVVIGRRAKDLTMDQAASAVAGFLVANDVSARDIQESDPASQWVRGKSMDTFAPLGPYFVTADSVDDWRDLRIRTWVNGELRQNEVCGDMVFGVEELVSFVSQDVTLVPGDIILTGTPSGVGAGFTPPRWLRRGDLVEVEITGLGRLTSPVV
jgi:2-keto-4-pentenoate hydratase/2-oxohepta-3-ene-1,7-dioic acid hydratase in catechol pathway